MDGWLSEVFLFFWPRITLTENKSLVFCVCRSNTPICCIQRRAQTVYFGVGQTDVCVRGFGWWIASRVAPLAGDLHPVLLIYISAPACVVYGRRVNELRRPLRAYGFHVVAPPSGIGSGLSSLLVATT